MKNVVIFLVLICLGTSACRKSRQVKSYVLFEKFSLELGETAIVKDTSVYELIEGEKHYPQYEVRFQRLLKDTRNWGNTYCVAGICFDCTADVEVSIIGAASLNEVAEFSYGECRNDERDYTAYSEMLPSEQKSLNERLYLAMHRVRPAIYGESHRNREKLYEKEKGKHRVELSLKLK